MNNPFSMFQNDNTQTEQESNRLRFRVGLLLCLFGGLLLLFLGVLFNLQIIHGEEYVNQADYSIYLSETVETDRGELVDRNGKTWVSNKQVHNITLDHTLMGSDRNEILSRLIALCQESGVTWSDTFPISKTAPWQYTRQDVFTYTTTNSNGETVTANTLLGALAKRTQISTKSAGTKLTAEKLMLAMCDVFHIELKEKDTIDPETRALLGVLYEIYLRVYEITYNEYTFASDVDISFITKVKERNFPGVEIESVSSRQYSIDSAAHVIGRVGPIYSEEWETYRDQGYPMDAIVGKDGVELAFESFLRGTSGTRRIETDSAGNLIREEWTVEPSPGNNVVLTLDATLQATTEDLLSNFAATLEDPAGAAAVMVDMTGGVLAMASYPDYSLITFPQDYNDMLTDPDKPLLNRVTQGLYAPGSTFKPLTAVAALSEGIITSRSTVICTGRYTYYPDAQPACWIYHSAYGYSNHGSENVVEAITDSCNIFFYDVGRRLGITKLGEYASMFGLGQKTGIEIGEYTGFVAGPETSAYWGQTWYGGNTMYASIGQENHQFTPLQLANYIATLVNGGNHYEAHLLKEVKSSDYSHTIYEHDPVLKDVIDLNPTALAAVKQGMYDLSKTYTMAQHFSSLPVEVGCKTGTAEVSGSSANAVFVCFAPYDNPQVALCIVAERGASGGSLASIAAGMLSQYFATADAQTTVDTENTLIP